MSLEDDKELLRQSIDFAALVGETVVLRQRGSEFWGCCPFHQEKTPSFKVNPSTGLWKCFGCGKGGDIFSYVMERENLDFMDALRYLSERAGIELSFEPYRSGPRRNRIKDALAAAETFFQTVLLRSKDAKAQEARDYLHRRGFGLEVCKRWRLGFAPGRGRLIAHLRDKGFSSKELLAADLASEHAGRLQDRFFNRVMFPIHDEHGAPIGFGGRVLGDARPKYLNSRDSHVFHKGKELYAFDRAKEYITATKQAILCEGYTDVIAMHEAGCTSSVASLGTALTADHLHLLGRCRPARIVLMFDGDSAGQRAAQRAVLFIPESTADLRCVVLPDKLDPAEFLERHGAEAMHKQIAAARPLMDFVLDTHLSSYDVSIPGNRVAALEAGAKLLAPLKRSVLLDTYATRLADALGADVEQTKGLIRAAPIQEPHHAAPIQELRRAAPTQESQQVQGAHQQGTQHSESLNVLSADERGQLYVEGELLAQLVQHPNSFRKFSDRLASFSWADARHEAIAWAILATPDGATPAQAVAAASSVVEEAPQLLAGGTLDATAGMETDETIAFLLDTVELYSTRRKVRSIKARVARDAEQNNEAIRALFEEATRLQQRVTKLTNRIRGRIDRQKNG